MIGQCLVKMGHLSIQKGNDCCNYRYLANYGKSLMMVCV